MVVLFRDGEDISKEEYSSNLNKRKVVVVDSAFTQESAKEHHGSLMREAATLIQVSR